MIFGSATQHLMTGWHQEGTWSNSVELASTRSSSLRANSTTASCIPRQIPRYGTCMAAVATRLKDS